jgi:hypothetical protein
MKGLWLVYQVRASAALAPVPASQSLTVLSHEPDATSCLPLQALSERTMQTYAVVGGILAALGEDFDATLVLA